MPKGVDVTNTLVNAPLPTIIEKLGLSIATAQSALDENSITLARQMADTKVTLNGEEYNLITLGFAPTFYAFTEATVQAKLDFSVAESTDFSIGGTLKLEKGIVAVSVSASYARKFEMKSEGSSSITARLVSLPAPERFNALLAEEAETEDDVS